MLSIRSFASILFAASLSVMLFSCQQRTAKVTTTQENPTNDAQVLAKNQFGEPVDADGAISYDALLVEMQAQDSMQVKVKGSVAAVCQAKGCWMNIVPTQAGQEEMFVKFKDYGFFVPKDITGREVVMQGKAYREVTPVDELRHYAKDNGESAEAIAAITEPKVELKFMATGVLLLEE